MLEPKIMARLKAEVPSVGQRVNWHGGALQGTTRPYLAISEVSAPRDYTHDGYSGLTNPRWQISVYGDSYVQARQTAAEVVTAMETWKADGVRFAPAMNKIDLHEEDTGLYHVAVDTIIYYEE